MMKGTKQLPRIEDVWPDPAGMAVKIVWQRKARKPDYVVLLGWIASGGELLASLRNAATFATAKVINYGGAIGWADNDDLTIDAVHLAKLADEQRAFTDGDLRHWQEFVKLSNAEASALFDVSMSTWSAYRSGETEVPKAIAMLARALARDPIIMQAHLRPSKAAGRPRKQAEG